jgi:fatty acid synthase
MGSQWTRMGTSLIQLPIFNESILKSHEILKALGIDLIYIITNTNSNILNNTVNSFVGVVAIQVNINILITIFYTNMFMV